MTERRRTSITGHIGAPRFRALKGKLLGALIAASAPAIAQAPAAAPFGEPAPSLPLIQDVVRLHPCYLAGTWISNGYGRMNVIVDGNRFAGRLAQLDDSMARNMYVMELDGTVDPSTASVKGEQSYSFVTGMAFSYSGAFTIRLTEDGQRMIMWTEPSGLEDYLWKVASGECRS